MKNLKRLINSSLVFLLLAMVFVSCVKKDDYYKEDSAESNRKQVVQIIGASDLITFARDVKPTKDTFILIDLRRYPNNEADLNQALTVKLQLNPQLIDEYDAANQASFIELPSNAYTFSSDINSINFQAGEAIKEISIIVDQSQLDLSKQYALGISIADAGTNAVANASLENAIYNVGVKNMYDGRYRLDGAFYHPTSSPGYDPFTVNVEMHTSGPNSVKLYVPEFGGYYSPGLFSGALNAFGAQEPEFTIDLATNKVTVQNSYSGAVTFYTMAPGYDSHYDPATRTIYAKWGYNYDPGPVFSPANNREWTDVFTYLGPR
jgi:hypothetical protein